MKGCSYTLNTDGFMQAKSEPSMCAGVNKHTQNSRNEKISFPYLMEKVNPDT